MMHNLTSEAWVFIIGFPIFLLWAITIFAFRRISVRHIEREMAKEGLTPPDWDKGLGMRLIMYAFTIVTAKDHKSLFINQGAILKYARKKDWLMSLLLLIATAAFLALVAANYFLYGDQYQRPY